jgi:hypothetical protein
MSLTECLLLALPGMVLMVNILTLSILIPISKKLDLTTVLNMKASIIFSPISYIPLYFPIKCSVGLYLEYRRLKMEKIMGDTCLRRDYILNKLMK